jgi:hypothetical protein
MAKEDIQLKISAAVESAEAAKSLGQLRKSLMEIQSLQAEVGESSGAEFDKLSQAANAASAKLAETRDRIGDIQDKNRTLEGTPIERLSGSFGLLKESIMNLDFDKAKIGAEGLLNTFTPVVDGKLVTGLAGVKGAFGMLGDGVKSLGSTFMSVGKALLTNPIFLLAAAIIAIVAVVILIMDKLGILKKVMDALGYAVGLVVQAFEALTDWLGLTTNAQEANAESAKKLGETQRAEIDATANKQKAHLTAIQGMTAEEIAEYRKKAGIRDTLNQNSFDIEKTRLTQTQATLLNEINALQELQDAGGELTEEQLKDLEQRKKDYETNSAAIVANEEAKVKAIMDANKKATDTLRDWKIKNIKDENERAKEQSKLDELKEITKINVAIEEQKRLTGFNSKEVRDLEATKTEIQKLFNTQRTGIEEAQNKKAADNYKNAVQKQLAEKEKSLQLGIEKLKKANADEETILKAQFKMESDLLKFKEDKRILTGKALELENIRLLNSQKERQAAFDKGELDEYNKNRVLRAENKVKNLEADLAKELGIEGLTADERLKKNREYDERLFNARREAAITRTNVELEDTKKSEDEKNAIKADSFLEIDALDKEYQALQDEYRTYEAEQLALTTQIIADKSQFKLDNYKQTEAEMALMDQKQVDAILRASNDQIVADMYAMQAELTNTELTEAQKAEIKERYRQLEIDREKEKEDKLRDLKVKNYNDTLELGQKANAAIQSLSDALFAFKKRDGTRTLAQQKKDAENQFKVNKALQISSAIITGIQSVMSAFANGMKNPIPLLGPATAGVYAVIAGITAAANVAKIAATKFDASSFTPPDTSGGGGNQDANRAADMAAADKAASAPTNFQPNQFFGLGQQTAVGMPGGPKPIKVYVSEGDIRDVSERVSVIETRAVY